MSPDSAVGSKRPGLHRKRHASTGENSLARGGLAECSRDQENDNTSREQEVVLPGWILKATGGLKVEGKPEAKSCKTLSRFKYYLQCLKLKVLTKAFHRFKGVSCVFRAVFWKDHPSINVPG